MLKLKLDLLNAFNSFEFNLREEKKLDHYQPKNPALLDLPLEIIKAAEYMKYIV
jgi:hypothetical protein